MRVVALYSSVLLCLCSGALARDPVVKVMADAIDPGTVPLLRERLAWNISDNQPPNGPQTLLERVGLLRGGEADVILLGCESGSAETLRAVVKALRAVKIEPIWLGAKPGEGDAFNRIAGDVMNAEGVQQADFPGFSLIPLRPGWTVARAQADYLAEVLGQWWWTCSPANPGLVREPLWPGTPPAFVGGMPERFNKTGRVDHVTMPQIARYVSATPPSGTALIYFSGGGYGQLGFLRNVNGLGKKLSPAGITLFALKYRTGRGDDVPLIDAERAVRWVRAHANEFSIDPNRIGVAGISAGANLVLQLISCYTPGNPDATDTLDRLSSRPDFAVVLTSWDHGARDSKFVFGAKVPPVFLRHAKDDPGFPLAEKIVAQLQSTGIPLDVKYLEKGGHGAFDQDEISVGKDWPEEFLPWLRAQKLYTEK